MGTFRNPYYNDPGIGQAAENLSKVFQPPSGSDMYGYAHAASENAKAKRLAEIYGYASSPNYDQTQADRMQIAGGLYNPNQSYYSVNTDAKTKQRGQDVEAGYHNYATDVRAKTDLATNAADNKTRTDVAMVAPIQKDAVRNVPPALADLYKVDPQQYGIVAAQPGEKNYLPDNRVLEGNTKPQTESEAKAAAFNSLTDEERRAVTMERVKPEIATAPTGPDGVAPGPEPMYAPQMVDKKALPVPDKNAQLGNYSAPGGRKGTAVYDPIQGGWVDSQSRAKIPEGSTVTSSTAASTTLNIGPSGEPIGAPPAGMAWKRNPDNSVALDTRGIPIALPIKGSPIDTKDQAAADKQAAANKSMRTQSDIVTQDIDRAVSAIQAEPTLTTGLGGQLTSGIGGSPGHDVRGLIKAVTANVGFQRLQEMRAASPTGGALGQVSDKENALLQATLGDLENSQGPTQLIQNLKRVKDVTLDIVHGPGNGPARANEQVFANKATGARIVGRNGLWFDANSGEPIDNAPLVPGRPQ